MDYDLPRTLGYLCRLRVSLRTLYALWVQQINGLARWGLFFTPTRWKTSQQGINFMIAKKLVLGDYFFDSLFAEIDSLVLYLLI